MSWKDRTFWDISEEVSSSISKLSFSATGWEQADLQLDNSCNSIELIMIEDENCDIPLEKVDKVRKKEYKELTKLHKEAYAKGIFHSQKACYIREFHECYPNIYQKH